MRPGGGSPSVNGRWIWERYANMASRRIGFGYCAWLLGLQQEPEPCAAADLLHGFSWDALAADSQDRSIPDDPFSIGL